MARVLPEPAPGKDGTPGEARDSSALLERSELLVRELDDAGYLVLRGFVPGDALAAARADLVAVLVGAGWLALPEDGSSALRAGPAPPASDLEARALYRALFCVERFHELAHHPTLVRLAASLLEAGDVLVLPRPVLRVVFPQRPDERPRSPAHQDHLGMQGTVDALTFWFPLVHCTREMGTVAVAAGSQRAGVRPYVARPGARVFSCDDRDLGESWVTTDFAPGDLCVFRSLTVHKALPNSSAHVRLSIDARYQRASEPVGELSVREDDDLSWETVYRGWGPDAPRYGWRRPGVRVVPYDPTYHTTHEPLVPAEL